MSKKLVVISGPTASGKSGYAVKLAKEINGAIISADSMQVYKGLDIGTAKITYQEMQGVPHYLLDMLYPDMSYNVASFQKDARLQIDKILASGKVPIIVGGTGLYIQSLVFDYQFESFQPLDYDRYQDLSLSELFVKLEQADKETALKIDSQNRRRVLHALALVEQTDKAKSIREAEQEQKLLYDIFPIALMPQREILYNNINKRVEMMIEDGLIAEVDFFKKKFDLALQIRNAIGYKETLAYLAGEIFDKTSLIEQIKQDTRRFAKRQCTWIRNQRISYHQIEDIKKEEHMLLSKIKRFLD